MPYWTTRTYERRGKVKINSPTSEILHFFQKEPEQYLEIAELKILQEHFRKPDSGEWHVSENVGLSCLPRTQFRIRWHSTESGARWQSWAALGVYVENSWTVRSIYSFDHSTEEDAHSPSSKICLVDEHAILQCSVFIYPFVKRSFDKAHIKLHQSMKCTLSQSPTSSP